MILTKLVKDPQKLETYGKFISPEEAYDHLRWKRMNLKVVSQTGEILTRRSSNSDSVVSKLDDSALIKVIAIYPAQAFEYAHYVIQGRFYECEPIMLQRPGWAHLYAKHIIKDRWPEAEPTILQSQDVQTIYMYANDVIKGRWPEGEQTLLTHAGWSYFYTVYMIKDRWPEAEPVIAKDRQWADQYNQTFKTNI